MSWGQKGHPQSVISTVAACLLLLLALLACKRKHEETPEEKAAEAEKDAKELERANKVLQKLASLQEKVKTLGAPKAMPSGVLKGEHNGYANFDVLLADELSDPPDSPKVRIRVGHDFGECAKHVKDKRAFSTDCVTPYVVVLKPTTFRTAVVAGDSYTTGKIDATAYVFDMSNSEMLGGGRITATTPDKISATSSRAQFELNEKLGESAFDSLVQELNVKPN